MLHLFTFELAKPQGPEESDDTSPKSLAVCVMGCVFRSSLVTFIKIKSYMFGSAQLDHQVIDILIGVLCLFGAL